MDFLERTLEDIIFNTPKELIEERGLPIEGGKLLRQVRFGRYGVADLILINRTGDYLQITVFELKKGKLDVVAAMQAARYCKAIS